MEQKPSRHSTHLISRLLGRWRGTEQSSSSQAQPTPTQTLEQANVTDTPSIVSSSVGDDLVLFEVEMDLKESAEPTKTEHSYFTDNLTANLDQRYGGQCLNPEQLPEFCDQLHRLMEMIRNIQSYANVTGEYPRALEERLSAEAREVAALAAEARNARDSIARARAQRRAVRAHRREIAKHLVALREEETKELENSVRLSDRKLFKSWENIREATNVDEFDNIIEEVKSKQNALDCLIRLVENRRSTLALLSSAPAPERPALPAPLALGVPPGGSSQPLTEQSARTRYFTSKRPGAYKRKRTNNPSRSMPVSNEPSQNFTTDSNSNPTQFNINPMTVPFEFINQSGVPANMLPSMGSNSNHNLNLNGAMSSFVPFRFGARQFGPTSEIRVRVNRDGPGDVVFEGSYHDN